jgi:hypothetical protein
MSFDTEGEQLVQPDPLEPGQTPAKGSKKWIAAAAAVAVVAALSVGGVAVAKVMGGGGAQPEDVLPANAIAFAKLDLNPSAGQKLAAYRLASKFPKVKSKVTSEDTSVKESSFGSIFTGDSGWGLSYKKDVEPWLGERVGVGVFPDMDADKEPEIGLSIAVTDQSAAKVALDKAIANAAKKDEKVGYAFADGYVIVSDTTAHAAALVKAGKTSTLAGSKYAEDVKKLDSDQIGVAWLDIAAAYKAVPKDMLAEGGLTMLEGANDPKNASGRVVISLRAESSFLELNGKGIEIKGGDPLSEAKTGTPGGMMASFPADVFGAVTIKGLGKAFGTVYTSVTAGGDPMGVKPMLAELGINSAKEVETLLGDETGVMMAGTTNAPEFAIRTQSSNPEAALAIARRALGASPAGDMGVTSSKITGPDGIVVGMGPDLNTAILEKSGSKLGGSEAFRQAMPDVAKASVAEYFNLAKIVPALASNPELGADMDSLKPLNALGLTGTSGAESTFRLRISFK